MNTAGPMKRYHRRYGLAGLALHTYMLWQTATFVMPRERLDWWPPYETVPKAVYFAADCLTPKFLEPPAGTYAQWRRGQLESSTPKPALPAGLETRVRDIDKAYADPVERNRHTETALRSDTGYQRAIKDRENTITDKTENSPDWLKGRGNPWTLAYAAGAATLAAELMRRKCKKRGSSK